MFNLVLQEEKQRSIGLPPLNTYVAPLSESVGFSANAASSNFQRTRDRLYCSHFGKTNHTVDKCFQLHGFPPGFGRGRGRPNDAPLSVNHVQHSADATSDSVVPTSASLTADQCSQLILIFNNSSALAQVLLHSSPCLLSLLKPLPQFLFLIETLLSAVCFQPPLSLILFLTFHIHHG